jgi:hypothetical protein
MGVFSFLKKKKPQGSASITIQPTQTIKTPQGTFTYDASKGTLMTPQGGYSVPNQEAANKILQQQTTRTRGGGSGGGGGGSGGGGGYVPPTPEKMGGGFSYVDPTTGKGYEVSPEGVKTEITFGKLSSSPVYSQQQLSQAQQKGFTGTVDVYNPTTNEIEKRQYLQGGRKVTELSSEQLTEEMKQGKIKSFNIEKNRRGQIIGIGEERTVETSSPITTIETLPTFNFEEYSRSFTTVSKSFDEMSLKEQMIDIGIGETGKKFIGIGIPFTPAFVSGQQIKTFVMEKAPIISKAMYNPVFYKPSQSKLNAQTFMIRTGAELIPTTPVETAMYGGGFGLLKTPVLLRVPVSIYVGYSGVTGAMNTNLTPTQRTASGLVGVGAGVGAFFESVPYLRGMKFKYELKTEPYVPVKIQPELFKAIEFKETRIGLIPRGSPLKEGITTKVKLPSISPLKRGGFEVKSYEKQLFLGKNQVLSTSQVGMFKEGIKISIERPFYTTPQEPFTKIPETRVSRLGLNEGLLSIPKSSEIGLGYPKESQIGLTKANVGWKESFKTFEIGKGTELESIKTYGTIKGIKRIGVTTIKGQGVAIYEYNIGKGTKGITNLYQGTSFEGTRVSGESIFSIGGTRTKTKEILSVTYPSITKTSLISTKGTSYKRITYTTTSYKYPSRKLVSGRRGSYRTPSTTIPKFTMITPSKTIVKYPRITPPISPPTKIKYPEIGGIVIPPSEKEKFILKPWQPKQQKGFSSFLVSMRRFGKFKPVGITRTQQQAFHMGKFYTRTTLGATFKVEGRGIKQPRNIFGYRTKPTKQGIFYIELPKYRLSTPTEKREIQFYKSLKMKGGRM